MKKLLTILLVSILALTLVACGGPKEEDVAIDIDAVKSDLEAANLVTDTLSPVNENVLSNVLTLNAENIESYHMYMGSGATAEEYGVFKCTSSDAAKEIADKLQARVEAQKTVYADYAPDAIPRLDNAVIRQKGVYVAYVVAENHAEALKIIDGYFK